MATSSSLGSLSQSAQLQKLKNAKIAMWFVGILTIAVQTFFFINVEKEYEDSLAAVARQHGVSLNSLDAAAKAEIEKERTQVVARARVIYGAGIGLGVIFILCALMVSKKPLIATMTGLVLYLGSIAAVAAIDSDSLRQGIIMKVVIVVILVSAVKAALAYEREQRQRTVG